MTIDIETAGQLLDFGRSIGDGPRAREQLEGAVAIHNLLEKQGLAYLADEVGMGKTYVTLGAIALFRHFNPEFRVLVLAPRANIQRKWQKERDAFVDKNIRFADLRNRAPDGRPAWPSIHCDNLLELLHESTLGANRDFFCRLTSFSLAVGSGQDAARATAQHLRAKLFKHLPWMPSDLLDARKDAFKDNLARALCCALPKFDLVVVDEAHNLKHGFAEGVAARNRVLGLMMGRESLAPADAKRLPGHGPRAQRVLFLSATPVEDTYRHLWNQLNVFGRAGPFEGLLSENESEAREAAERFLIRRVTNVTVGGATLTRNLYRREWRQGGVQAHDLPIEVDDDRQRLVLALVQKKVAELLGHERFGGAFQMGMLASFESFQQTTKLGIGDEDELEEANFDGSEQTQDALAREGIDVQSINDIARSYKSTFREELPHPKMDAVASALASAWQTGEKALVFVRRVASVKELKQKLDDAYDAWLIARLRTALPASVLGAFEAVRIQYENERRRDHEGQPSQARSQDGPDRGGRDTFFAWFFRGDGPSSVLSAANMQLRFLQRSTVFEDNALAWILQCTPQEMADRLSFVLGTTPDTLAVLLEGEVRYFLSDAKRHRRADIFVAVQAAACSLLRQKGGEHADRARAVWHARWEQRRRPAPVAGSIPKVVPLLAESTFFDALAREPTLSKRLWPVPDAGDATQQYRERFLRAQLLASATRLGHGLIDLYAKVIGVLGTLESGRLEDDDGEEDGRFDITTVLLDLLRAQMDTPLANRTWALFDELAEIADHFELILDVNAHDLRQKSLSEASTAFGRLLREQRPVAGMSGGVNQTLVQQFRMPGYPFVLVTTDVLQEGEDLHTFCGCVHHYGISWTPSSMEQRTGRIDRVRSKIDRRLSAADALHPDDKLQVHFPYLQGTVEVLQVRRVLDRMDTFIRLMHEGLSMPGREGASLNVNQDMHAVGPMPTQPTEVLRTAFPIAATMLSGRRRSLAVRPQQVAEVTARFDAIATASLEMIEWEGMAHQGRIMGTARVGARVQPFTLLLGAAEGHAIVRCISPVGRVYSDATLSKIEELIRATPVKVVLLRAKDAGTYDLTVQSEVLLGKRRAHDRSRVDGLVSRVVHQADAIEKALLAGQDAPLSKFRLDFAKEATMSRDWHSFCNDASCGIEDDSIDVDLVDGRSHRVRVESTSGAWQLTAVVATPSVLDQLDAFDPPSNRCWLRNRLIDLVGYRIDRRGRLVANAWVPKLGLEAEEFVIQVRLLAREADRFEFLLSGANVH